MHPLAARAATEHLPPGPQEEQQQALAASGQQQPAQPGLVVARVPRRQRRGSQGRYDPLSWSPRAVLSHPSPGQTGLLPTRAVPPADRRAASRRCWLLQWPPLAKTCDRWHTSPSSLVRTCVARDALAPGLPSGACAHSRDHRGTPPTPPPHPAHHAHEPPKRRQCRSECIVSAECCDLATLQQPSQHYFYAV